MKSCYLCDLRKNKHYVFWENDLLFAAFDNNPVSPGHTLLVPNRHAIHFDDLTQQEWNQIQTSIKVIITNLKKINLKEVYQRFILEHETDQSVWFCEKALENLQKNSVPDAYNHGFNDGKAAGRTVDHFHWHIIPRYEGDMTDAAGGVRFVIPEMGDYSVSRNI